MGSCHSIPALIESNNYHSKKECFICKKWINSKFVKCKECDSVLHLDCAINYKNSKKKYLTKCPYCKKHIYIIIELSNHIFTFTRSKDIF